MPKLYSAKTGGFYDPDIHATMPDDARAVSDEDYAALFTAQRDGHTIVAGADGAPVAKRPQPASDRDTARDVRDRRNRLLAESDWAVLRSLEQGEPVPPEWKAYRQKLRDITDIKKFPKVAEKDWPATPAEPE